MQIEIILGLGSNLGDRLNYLNQAIFLLKERQIVMDIAHSTIHRTKALLMDLSPSKWDKEFLNMALRGRTSLSPEELLKQIKNIEQDLGRKNTEKWAPREIDIDILAYGDNVINQNELVIPHVHLLERSWALIPFAEICPEYRYPVPGKYYQKTIIEIANHLFEAVK